MWNYNGDKLSDIYISHGKERKEMMSRDRIIQLQECAEELGFETIQQALDAGYHEVQDLDSNTFTLEKIDVAGYEQEKAHEAWLEEKQQVLEEQRELHDHLMELGYDTLAESVFKAIEFIEKGEM